MLLYLLPEGPVLSGGLVNLLCPVAEHTLRSYAGLYLREDGLEGGESDGVSSSLQLGQTLIVLYYGAVPVQTMGRAVLHTREREGRGEMDREREKEGEDAGGEIHRV